MNDLIDRQAALKELAVYIHLIDKTMGKGILTDDDCMEAAKSVLGEDEPPAVQPDHTADIGKKVSISCSHENDLISRQAAIDALARMMPRSYTPDGSHPADEEIFRAQEVFADCIEALEILTPAQPELIEKAAYIRGFEQGRTQGMVDSQGWKKMNKQRKVVITTTYNEMGIIIDTKVEEVVQPEVIRCKDCDWWTKQEDSVQGRCELMQMYPAGGWYCGNARRRQE